MTFAFNSLQRTAAEVLAAAVFEMFPEVVLLGGSETASGFYYDFYFPHPLNPELPFQIEERMRQIVKEERGISKQEMVGVSAKEFLKSKGHFERAESVEGPGLYTILRMGSFIDLVFGAVLKNSSEVSHFKIFPPVSMEDQKIRIWGVACESKESLKNFLKKKKSYEQTRHERIGELRKFWTMIDGKFVWLKDGLEARRRLSSLLKENFFPESMEVGCPNSSDRHLLHNKILKQKNVRAVLEEFLIHTEKSSVEDTGLFEPREAKAIQITTSIENAISFLQSIGKTLNILGFNYCVRFTPSNKKGARSRFLIDALQSLDWTVETSEEEDDLPRLDFLVADGIGRKWSAACVCAKESIFCHIIVERNLALLLELQEFVNFIV